MRKPAKRKPVRIASLSDIFDATMKRMIRHNLSIQEIAENTDIDEELLEIFLNNENNVINDLSRLLEFLKINTYYKENYFTAYKIIDAGKQLKIARIIKPKCSIYFDKATQKFYRFYAKFGRHNIISETRKQVFMSEMKDYTENYLRTLQ